MMKRVYYAVRTGSLNKEFVLSVDETCLLRGTDWVFKQSSLCLVYDEKCLLRRTDWVFI
jgi:hypothetical protein